MSTPLDFPEEILESPSNTNILRSEEVYPMCATTTPLSAKRKNSEGQALSTFKKSKQCAKPIVKKKQLFDDRDHVQESTGPLVPYEPQFPAAPNLRDSEIVRLCAKVFKELQQMADKPRPLWKKAVMEVMPYVGRLQEISLKMEATEIDGNVHANSLQQDQTPYLLRDEIVKHYFSTHYEDLKTMAYNELQQEGMYIADRIFGPVDSSHQNTIIEGPEQWSSNGVVIEEIEQAIEYKTRHRSTSVDCKMLQMNKEKKFKFTSKGLLRSALETTMRCSRKEKHHFQRSGRRSISAEHVFDVSRGESKSSSYDKDLLQILKFELLLEANKKLWTRHPELQSVDFHEILYNVTKQMEEKLSFNKEESAKIERMVISQYIPTLSNQLKEVIELEKALKTKDIMRKNLHRFNEMASKSNFLYQ